MNDVPDYVKDLQAMYGMQGDGGFGSAVFFQTRLAADGLEAAALDNYKYFVGKSWTPSREAAWMSTWQCVYARAAGDRHDVVAELRDIGDRTVRSSVTMLFDAVDHAAQARQALAAALDNPAVSQLSVYRLGDGEAMSGLLIGARRDDGAAVFLVFLMD